MTLAITIGRGRKQPRGRLVHLADEVPPARALEAALASQTANEAWWSQHTWKDNHRGQAGWLSAAGVGVDMDYHDAAGEHVIAPADLAAAADQAAREAKIPGSLFHLTPRGFRVVFMFPAPVTDRDVFARAARGAADLVAAAVRSLRLTGYTVDDKALLDTARFLYAPRALVEGTQRDAPLLVLREEPYNPVTLAPPPARPKLAPALTFQEGAKRYNAEHAREWPRSDASCPMCGHHECFGRLPSDPTRWACFSASHAQVGIKGDACHHGDVLDLDAHAAGCQPAELLRREGYLGAAVVDDTVLRRAPEQAQIPGTVASIEQGKLKGLSKSYASLCAILRNDRRIVPEPLEWDEMLCGPVMGGLELEDHNTGAFREKLELLVHDKNGKALQFTSGMIEQAVHQVAHEHPFHPVREYLEGLEWDGTERIASVADEILGLERTQTHQILLRRWFIGCVARIFQPGCELQMVLVFEGTEDLGKSRFFKALAGASWFSDERVNLEDKDNKLLLQRIWLLEWGELAALRGSSWETVKGFITSTMNDFRPPYGRKIVRAPRHCVIVGTSNDPFLHGREGERRFWPMRVPAGWSIPFDLVTEWRDQLWAEAVRLYRAGEQWHLTPEEKVLLRVQHQDHIEEHPWEEVIGEWLHSWTAPVTTSAVLEKAVRKPMHQWTKGDQMAVARVLKTLGYARPGDKGRGRTGDRERVWAKVVPQKLAQDVPSPTSQVGDVVGERVGEAKSQ